MLIAADRREFSGLLRYCRDVKRLGWPVRWARMARLSGHEVVLVANGMGAERAAKGVEVAYSAGGIDLICSMGFCGALEDGMKIGDIVVADRVRYLGGEYAAAQPESARKHWCGMMESIDHVAQTSEEKCALRLGGASAVEMEAGGVAAKAAQLGARFCCVRSVTDLASESFRFDFNAALHSDGRFGTMRLIAAICRRPLTLLPELLRLGMRSRAASLTLGEFLANCRF